MKCRYPRVVSDHLLSYLLSNVKKHANEDSQYVKSTPDHFSYHPGGISSSPLHFYQFTLKNTQANKGPQFTIGPDNEPESLRKYALLLSGNPDGASPSAGRGGIPTVHDICKGLWSSDITSVKANS
jgi:hypothetical protein